MENEALEILAQKSQTEISQYTKSYLFPWEKDSIAKVLQALAEESFKLGEGSQRTALPPDLDETLREYYKE